MNGAGIHGRQDAGQLGPIAVLLQIRRRGLIRAEAAFGAKPIQHVMIAVQNPCGSLGRQLRSVADHAILVHGGEEIDEPRRVRRPAIVMVGVEAPPEILHDHHLFSRQRRVFIDMIQLDGGVARQLFHDRLEIGDDIIAHQGGPIKQAHGDGIDARAFAPFPHEFVKGAAIGVGPAKAKARLHRLLRQGKIHGQGVPHIGDRVDAFDIVRDHL